MRQGGAGESPVAGQMEFRLASLAVESYCPWSSPTPSNHFWARCDTSSAGSYLQSTKQERIKQDVCTSAG